MTTLEIPRADWQCKLVVIGDSGVGKTSVMRRFTDNEFSFNFVATIGIDFKVRTIKVKEKMIKVQIWDTAGQERFRSITTAYYRGAKGVIIVYDITSLKSFSHVNNWVINFNRWAGDDVQALLVGNKCDLEDQRVVTKMAGEKLAKEHGMEFSETSAKDCTNVDIAFMRILEKIVEKHFKKEEKSDRPKTTIKLDTSKPSRRPACCKS
uniref:Ras-related protein Rab-1 n=2 Tax=Ciona intestinalis TaxID=7719 RepID=F6UXB3_CIOIN|nr:ras-related protein Rab-10-like isoform X1 [Ciona intestinalis]|eukprot:XP_009857997.1 ras-related protein Rab-10-like isoform X1 [Ciona intestinalis]